MDHLLSPDRTVRVDLFGVEMRMSHTVMNPVVTHVPTGDVLLDLSDTLWDASPSFEDDGRLILHLREYPGTTPGFSVRLDLDRLEAEFLPSDGVAPDAGSSPNTVGLEELWRSLAPQKRLPEALARRRRALDDRRAEADRIAREAARRDELDAERARQAIAQRESDEAQRQGDLDRQRVGTEARKRAAENEEFMRVLTARAHGLDPGAEARPEPVPPAPSLRNAAGGFGRALAGLGLTLGSIGIYLGAGYGLTVVLVRVTPLHLAPAWIAWGVATTASAFIMVVGPFVLLAYLMRHYRG